MNASDRNLQPIREPENWAPDSWRSRVAIQQPTYEDQQALEAALEQLATRPPLVTSWEVLALKRLVAEAQEGRRFVLQGGDCAESFADCTNTVITNRLKVLLQMSLVLVHGLRLPVLRVGRFAGQYAKPRSTDTETRDGVTLPSYRGDIINSPQFTAEARRADPHRLLHAHASSAMTMNFVRALIDGGFADLHHPEYWDLAWVDHSPLASEYRQMVAGISDSLRFMETLAGEPRWTASRAWTSSPRTRRCCCTTSRPRRAACRASGAGSTWARISPGSACAPRRWTAPTWNTSAASATRSRSRSARAMQRDHLLRLIDVLNPG